jgi:hypothetical protein
LAVLESATNLSDATMMASSTQFERWLGQYPQWLLDHTRSLGALHPENVEFCIRVDMLFAALAGREARRLGIHVAANPSTAAEHGSDRPVSKGGAESDAHPPDKAELAAALQQLESAKDWLEKHAQETAAEFKRDFPGDSTLAVSRVASDLIITARLEALTGVMLRIQTQSAFLEERHADVVAALQPMIPTSLRMVASPTPPVLAQSSIKFLQMLQQSYGVLGDAKGGARCRMYLLLLQLHRLSHAGTTKGLLDPLVVQGLTADLQSLLDAISTDETEYVAVCVARLLMAKHRVLCREGGDFAAALWVLFAELCDRGGMLREDFDDDDNASASESNSDSEVDDATLTPAVLRVLQIGFHDLLIRDAAVGSQWIVPLTIVTALASVSSSALNHNPDLHLLQAQAIYCLHHFKSGVLCTPPLVTGSGDTGEVDVVAKCEKLPTFKVPDLQHAVMLARFVLTDLDGNDVDGPTRQLLEDQVAPFFDLRNQGAGAARIHQRLERFLSGVTVKTPIHAPGESESMLAVRLFRALAKKKTGDELSWSTEMGHAIQHLALLPSNHTSWIDLARRCVDRLVVSTSSTGVGDTDRGPPRDSTEFAWLIVATSRAYVCLRPPPRCGAPWSQSLLPSRTIRYHMATTGTVKHSPLPEFYPLRFCMTFQTFST